MSAPGRPQLAALSAVRYPAAALVVAGHFSRAPAILHVDVGAVPQGAVSVVMSAGHAALSLFFVLSGYLLTYGHQGRPFEAKRWWRERLARLYPAFALSLVLLAPQFFVLRLGYRGDEWVMQHQVVSALLVVLLLQAWVPPVAEAWNGVSWTLSAELLFSLLFPWLLGRLERTGRAKAAGLTALCLLVTLALPLAYLVWQPDGAVPTDVGRHGEHAWLTALRMNPLSRLPEFLAGMGLAVWLPPQGEWRRGRWPDVLVALGLGVMAVGAAVFPVLPVPLWHAGCATVAAALLVAGLGGGGRAARALEAGWLVRLSGASYGMYLFHVPLVALGVLAFGRFGAPFPGSAAVVFLGVLALATAAGLGVKRVVEPWGLRLVLGRAGLQPPR
ncbi:MAG: acyltransferase [Myxococcaceae bacterium]|nr:acyltransferase [Myxococcaceae bacterium]